MTAIFNNNKKMEKLVVFMHLKNVFTYKLANFDCYLVLKSHFTLDSVHAGAKSSKCVCFFYGGNSTHANFRLMRSTTRTTSRVNRIFKKKITCTDHLHTTAYFANTLVDVHMAAIDFVLRYRFVILLWSVLEILLFSAVIYGWASLVVVLKHQRYFSDLCEADEANFTATTTTAVECLSQERQLNLVFTVGVFVFTACGLITGSFLDKFGPRKTRLLTVILFGLAYLFFGLSNKDRSNLLFPGMVFLASAGQTAFLTVIQVAGIFERWKSSVISLFNGALDSSAIMLLLAKLTYESGTGLKWIYMFYFIAAMVTVLAFTFLLPPTIIQRKTRTEVESTPVAVNSEETQGNELLIEDNVTAGNGALADNAGDKGEQKVTEKKIVFHETETALIVNTESYNYEKEPNILQLVIKPEYILVVMFVAIHTLRLWFYVGSLNSYLEFMSDNNKDTVSKYTNAFGIAQFAGFIFAPMVGVVMDWKPKGHIGKTDLGFVLGFTLTNVISLLLNILVLVKNLEVQYASFIIQVVLRAFVYASFGSFIFHKFPIVHFGKLFGTGMAISACFGCIQYALFTLTENTLEKDQYWVNVGLLVLSLVPFSLPVYLWWKERKCRTKAITS